MKYIYLLLIVLLFSGCNSLEKNMDINIAEGNIVEVSIRNSEYELNNILIEKGTTIKWTNYDSQGHTITSENYFDSKTISKGQSFSYTFNDIGEFEYYCKIHQNVKGSVVVQ